MTYTNAEKRILVDTGLRLADSPEVERQRRKAFDDELAAAELVAAGGSTAPAEVTYKFWDTTPETFAEDHIGAMVALVPADPEALAIEGGDPVEELHTTMFYLGDAADIPDELQAAILAEIEQRASAYSGPLEAQIFGAALWNPNGDDPSLVWNVGGSELLPFHDAMRQAIPDSSDWSMPEQHQPWVAHLCAGYGSPEGLLDLMPEALTRAGPVVYDRVRVAYGPEVFDFPLGGMVASGWERFPIRHDPKSGRFTPGENEGGAGGAELTENETREALWDLPQSPKRDINQKGAPDGMPDGAYYGNSYKDWQSAKEWGDVGYSDWHKGLSKDEATSFKKYTSSSDMAKINRRLRGQEVEKPLSDSIFNKRVSTMDAAIGRGRLPEDAVLHRGINGNGAKAMSDAVASGHIKPGAILAEDGFMSTSVVNNVSGFGVDAAKRAGEPMNGVTMHIAAKKGARGAYMPPGSSLTKWDNEHEIILPRGSQLRVTRVERKYDGHGDRATNPSHPANSTYKGAPRPQDIIIYAELVDNP